MNHPLMGEVAARVGGEGGIYTGKGNTGKRAGEGWIFFLSWFWFWFWRWGVFCDSRVRVLLFGPPQAACLFMGGMGVVSPMGVTWGDFFLVLLFFASSSSSPLFFSIVL